MIGNVSNDNLISGNLINQNENINGVEKVEEQKNPYAKIAELEDSTNISDEARELLRREKEIEYFKSLVLDSPMSGEEVSAIMELIRNGEFIDNKDLAEAMQVDDDLLSHLFGSINIEEAVS